MARRGPAVQVEITEGAIRVSCGERVLTIPSMPPPADADEDADFFVQLDAIEHWDAPDDDVVIEIAELQLILEAIEEQVARHGLIVVFE